jgi:hypothetical protein
MKPEHVVASTVDTEETVELPLDGTNLLAPAKVMMDRVAAGWRPVKFTVTFRKRDYPLGEFAPLIMGPQPKAKRGKRSR